MAGEFDLAAELPAGTSVLEASAGTGKTWTLAAITAKLVGEGTALERMLLVTFTRAATGELRERIRDRLIGVGRGLEAIAGGRTPAEHDPVVELLAACPPEELDERRRRITRALADFDAATITTIHGFCQEVLGGLGVLGDLDPDYEFSEDLSELTRQVTDDLYVWRFHSEEDPALSASKAREVANVAISHPELPLADASGELPQMRRRLAEKARDLFDDRKRQIGVLGFDDLLTRLVAALDGPHEEEVARRVGCRWDVVLVDEFQDTDPLQWEIVSEAFAERDASGRRDAKLVLVGDPKQAIYAFRGADVFAYLQAKEKASWSPTLGTNYRSDQPLLAAYDALFGNAQLGHAGITYRPVRAAPHHQESGLRGAPVRAPLRFRLLERDGFDLTNRREIRNPDANAAVIADVASDIVELLSSEARVRPSDDGDEVEVMPRHLAVLVRANWQAAAIRDALTGSGVPAVINGAGSVFATEIAQQWRRLLVALDRPSSRSNARTAALTSFFGWSPERLDGASDEELEGIHRRLHRYARVLRERGVAAMVEEMNAVEAIPARMLARADGERDLTDLRHIAQLLHAEAVNEGRGLSALTAWLYRRVSEAGDDIAEERSRRLDSDEEAVQVLTVHRSKGLEFPIVYLPFLWNVMKPNESGPATFHDEDGRRTLDVSLEGGAYDANRLTGLTEERGEELRLAYVALTRARHQAVVWWAPGRFAGDSAISRLLMSRADDGTIPSAGEPTPSDEVVRARLGELAARCDDGITAEPIPPAARLGWEAPPRPRGELATARFDRGLDWLWRRNSYSSIAAAAHEAEAARVASEPERDPLLDDEPEEGEEPVLGGEDDEAGGEAVPSPWEDLPGGRRFGSLVHGLLERVDFAAEDLDAELSREVAAGLAHHRIELDEGTLVAALRKLIETPLGPLTDDLRLRDVGAGDRLDELTFELPLVGGERPRGKLAVGAIGELLAERLPADDPVARYAARLGEAELGQAVRGYLTGSIDLALRLPGAGSAPRFAVVDYKTNWLGADEEPLTSRHYRPAAVAAAMERGHYWLQALLYLVALHRYLRWRLPGYDPERNLAGVLYLFVRGMAGAETPLYGETPAGVAAWRPPVGVIEALSALLDEGSES